MYEFRRRGISQHCLQWQRRKSTSVVGVDCTAQHGRNATGGGCEKWSLALNSIKRAHYGQRWLRRWHLSSPDRLTRVTMRSGPMLNWAGKRLRLGRLTMGSPPAGSLLDLRARLGQGVLRGSSLPWNSSVQRRFQNAPWRSLRSTFPREVLFKKVLLGTDVLGRLRIHGRA